MPVEVITQDDEVLTIQTLEQGPPGPQGPVGPQGIPGAQGAPGPQGPPGGGGLEEAPTDTYSYGRVNMAWGRVLPLSGGALTGPLSVDGTVTTTGNYIINSAGIAPTLIINSTLGKQCQVLGQNNSQPRWLMQYGDGTAESGGATGSGGNDFNLIRYNNSGNSIDTPLKVARLTGSMTLTADLTIHKLAPDIILDKTDDAAAAIITSRNGSNRWHLYLGLNSETGGNAGSDIQLSRFNDAGTYIDSPLTINRASGAATMKDVYATTLSTSGTIMAGNAGDAARMFWGNTGVRYLDWNGATFTLNGGPLTCSSDVHATNLYATGSATVGSSGNAGTLFFGNTGVDYLAWNGAAFTLNGGPLNCSADVHGNTVTATGDVHGNTVSATSSITAGNAGTTATYQFGNTGLKNLSYDGTNFNLAGGNFYCADVRAANLYTTGVAMVGSGGDAGTMFFGNTGVRSLQWTGAVWSLNGGGVNIAGDANMTGNGWIQAGTFTVGSGGTAAQQARISLDGANGANGGSTLILAKNHTYNWTLGHQSAVWGGGNAQSNLVLYNNAVGQFFLCDYTNNAFSLGASLAYKPGGGPWADSSDERIKTVLGDYDSGLDQILALQPKRFTYKGNDTAQLPSNVVAIKGDDIDDKIAPVAPYPNSGHHVAAVSGKEYIGLIAQDCEEAMPEMVSLRAGYIDGEPVDDIRQLDTTALVFALVNAVKTLTARIEQLETQIAQAPA